MKIYITISGADGSGKTTVARFLVSLLSNHGSVCFHWLRGSHILASFLARIFSRVKSFRGSCNPYYKICMPEGLKGVWIFLEFVSLLPHLFAGFLLKKICKVAVCDRGLLDFVVWLVVTLDAPWILNTLIGRFLLGLVSRENVVYLYADANTLARRADVSKQFIVRELATYNVLVKYFARCSIDTGRNEPVRVVAEVIRCLEKQRH